MLRRHIFSKEKSISTGAEYATGVLYRKKILFIINFFLTVTRHVDIYIDKVLIIIYEMAFYYELRSAWGSVIMVKSMIYIKIFVTILIYKYENYQHTCCTACCFNFN